MLVSTHQAHRYVEHLGAVEAGDVRIVFSDGLLLWQAEHQVWVCTDFAGDQGVCKTYTTPQTTPVPRMPTGFKYVGTLCNASGLRYGICTPGRVAERCIINAWRLTCHCKQCNRQIPLPCHAESHYDVLGVPATASSSEIKGAFRKLALKLHPDVNNTVSLPPQLLLTCMHVHDLT